MTTNRAVLKDYIFESFLNYGKEYRIHVSTEGAFLTWRKVRRSGEVTWFFNSTNCSWLGEENPEFDLPKCFNEMCEESVKALNAVGLDIGGVDIRVQKNTNKNPKFAIIEINSACSMGSDRDEKGRIVPRESIASKAYVREFVRLVSKKRS
jgi:D-alanine-D-alanine ligase-like ATP-grasp enzyme